MPYSIDIWQSQNLINYCSSNRSTDWEAANNVKEAFDQMADELGISADVSVRKVTGIEPPTEKAHKDINTVTPCVGEHIVLYTEVNYWWADKTDCLNNIADDCNILLTDTRGLSGHGGPLGGNHAHYEGGRACADAYVPPSMSERDFIDTGHNWTALVTAVHEIGHNIISSDTNHHYAGNAHHMDGSDPYNAYAQTPMTGNGTNWELYDGYNACNNEVPSMNLIHDDANDLRFSDCVIANLN